MKNSNDKGLRSMCARIGKLAAEIGLAVAIGAFAIGTGTALAARHGGGYHGGNHGGVSRRVSRRLPWWLSGGHWGGGYYAPGPDIYVAPEPYAYGYATGAVLRPLLRRGLRSAAIAGRRPVLWTLMRVA